MLVITHLQEPSGSLVQRIRKRMLRRSAESGALLTPAGLMRLIELSTLVVCVDVNYDKCGRGG